MAKNIIEYMGYKYDSLPEACFAAWCEEALRLNIIRDYYRQVTYDMTPTYTTLVEKVLKTKTKYVRKTLLRASTYTADFKIFSNVELCGLEVERTATVADALEPVYVIDVKGESNNTNAKGLFSLKQKMVMHTNGIYVNKVIPGEFFVQNGWPTELPSQCYMKQGGIYAWLRKHQNKCDTTIGEVYR